MTGTNTFFKLITLLSFMLFGYAARAQEQKEVKEQTYTISDKGSISNIQPYIDALNNSDMRNHRLLNQRYTIVFEKGVNVELFSASEIAKSGFPINLSEYPENFSSARREPIFSLADNNFIIESHTSSSKH